MMQVLEWVLRSLAGAMAAGSVLTVAIVAGGCLGHALRSREKNDAAD